MIHTYDANKRVPIVLKLTKTSSSPVNFTYAPAEVETRTNSNVSRTDSLSANEYSRTNSPRTESFSTNEYSRTDSNLSRTDSLSTHEYSRTNSNVTKTDSIPPSVSQPYSRTRTTTILRVYPEIQVQPVTPPETESLLTKSNDESEEPEPANTKSCSAPTTLYAKLSVLLMVLYISLTITMVVLQVTVNKDTNVPVVMFKLTSGYILNGTMFVMYLDAPLFFMTKPIALYAVAVGLLAVFTGLEAFDVALCSKRKPSYQIVRTGERYWLWLSRVVVFVIIYPLLAQQVGILNYNQLYFIGFLGMMQPALLWVHEIQYNRGIYDKRTHENDLKCCGSMKWPHAVYLSFACAIVFWVNIFLSYGQGVYAGGTHISFYVHLCLWLAFAAYAIFILLNCLDFILKPQNRQKTLYAYNWLLFVILAAESILTSLQLQYGLPPLVDSFTQPLPKRY